MMTLKEICLHERRGMLTRQQYGYDQHDDHLWRWLNWHLSQRVIPPLRERLPIGAYRDRPPLPT